MAVATVVPMGVVPTVATILPHRLVPTAAMAAVQLAAITRHHPHVLPVEMDVVQHVAITPPTHVPVVLPNVLRHVRDKRPKPAQTVQQDVSLVVEMTAITHVLVSVEESVEHHAVEHVRVSVGTEVAK
ncbi:MAG: hypothetical protein K2O17_02905 [Bacteroidaceae bacterium]|nr:hypothetical protein [Bacteroidaceae bacterium]